MPSSTRSRVREVHAREISRSQFQLDLKKSEPERTMSGVGGVEVTSPLLDQGFSPVTFTTGTDGAMGTVEKKR